MRAPKKMEIDTKPTVALHEINYLLWLNIQNKIEYNNSRIKFMKYSMKKIEQ